jgi:ferric-dicitrate binding protein FerR (iron transport regulator)
MNESNRRDEGDEAFVRRIKAALDDGDAHLEARLRSRLTRARHAERARPSRPFWARQWAPAAGVAAAAVLAVALWPGAQPGSGVDAPLDAAGFDGLEIVLAEENLELLEDLDFYEWVDADAGSI